MGYYSDAFQHCLTLIQDGVPRLLREQNCTKKKLNKKKPRAKRSLARQGGVA
jgi:hypothetical protein